MLINKMIRMNICLDDHLQRLKTGIFRGFSAPFRNRNQVANLLVNYRYINIIHFYRTTQPRTHK